LFSLVEDLAYCFFSYQKQQADVFLLNLEQSIQATGTFQSLRDDGSNLTLFGHGNGPIDFSPLSQPEIS